MMKAAPPPPPMIVDDHPCPGCGYNLRGLAANARCPECGLRTVRAERIDDPLSQMPLGIIRTLRLGCWSASAWITGVIILAMLNVWSGFGGAGLAGFLVAAALLWQVTAVLLTPSFTLPQAVWHGFGPKSRLRIAARWLQVGWLLGAGANLLRDAQPAAQPVPDWILAWSTGLGVLVGLAGLVTLGVLLTGLAEWARDEDAAKAFGFSMWMTPIATVLLLVVELPGPYISLGLLVLWVVALGAYPYAMLSLARSVELSVVHARENSARMERRLQRQSQYDEHVGSTVEQMDEARRKRGLEI
jgi:hypothetical protein